MLKASIDEGHEMRMRKPCYPLLAVSLLLTLSLLLAAGCASRRPAGDKPPTARVTELNSTVITPRLVKFQARLVVRNNATTDLDFERVDWAVDLQGRELFTDSFDGMKRTKGRGSQTVTFPFQIAMEDVFDEAAAILAVEAMEVGFRGTVYPAAASGYSPLPFSDTVSIPIPKMPIVAFEGTEGVPLGDAFAVRIRVNNRNAFPLTIASVDSYLEINQVKYRLLHTEEDVEIQPGEWRTVSLRMENNPNKTLSAVLNTLLTPKSEFDIGGSIECRSPYGWIVVPIDLGKRNL
jgi:LEA14-like dessication related protein